jgi:Zn-dependent protease with chaperone function
MTSDWYLLIANHIWQSTLFAGAAGSLTLVLRENHARVRHRIWVVASLKFLLPFSLLVNLGGRIPWTRALQPVSAGVSFSGTIEQVGGVFVAPAESLSVSNSAAPSSVLPIVLWTVWGSGFLFVVCSSWRRWRRVVAIVRTGSPLDLVLPIKAVSSPSFLEPGVFGVFRPVLLLPEGIIEQLTPEQWTSVVAHELCHVRHRDNLIGTVQMFVEVVFWFHPLVWWLGKRICHERELACDEKVLGMGCEPRVYAQGFSRSANCIWNLLSHASPGYPGRTSGRESRPFCIIVLVAILVGVGKLSSGALRWPRL